ncbi:MAG TPA: hypothetical protein VGJ95_19265 [Pseudonocardiaceae bacterium]
MPNQSRGPLEQVSVLVGQAVGVAGWLSRTGWGIARRLPGGAAAERAARPVQELVAAQLQRPLRSLGLLDHGPARREPAAIGLDPTGARLVDGQVGARRVTAVVRPRNDELEPLRAAMAELLNWSVEQTREQGERQLYAGILCQLLPEEARVLAALSDGSPYPLVHVASRGPFGGIKRLVLENASTVGRAAGTALVLNTPTLVTRAGRRGPGGPVAGRAVRHPADRRSGPRRRSRGQSRRPRRAQDHPSVGAAVGAGPAVLGRVPPVRGEPAGPLTDNGPPRVTLDRMVRDQADRSAVSAAPAA